MKAKKKRKWFWLDIYYILFSSFFGLKLSLIITQMICFQYCYHKKNINLKNVQTHEENYNGPSHLPRWS